MTKSILSVACLASLMLGGFAAPAAAQQPQPQFVPQVAILDLPRLLKNHARFKQAEEQMKTALQVADETLKKDREAFETSVKQLQEFRVGTPDFKAKEEQLAQQEASLSLRVNLTKKNFAEVRTKALFDVQQEVSQYVRYYAEQTGILVVLNFNGDPVDPNNPQSIMQGLNSPVLYRNVAIDITEPVLKLINDQVQIPPGPQAQIPGAPQR